MTKKVLFTASIAKHLLRFHLPYLKWFKDEGYEVHIACEGDEEVPFTDKTWKVPFVRSPFTTGHFKAHKILKEIIDDENYSLIHCHTPMASIVTRLAAREARRNGTKVLYTAHGFHFYTGAPFVNWLTYYPVELFTSGYADAIITINQEDYSLIKSKGSKNPDYFLIPGVGVKKKRFFDVDENIKKELRKEKGFEKDDILLVYAAEFIERKNHQFLIDSSMKLFKELPHLKILFAGRGKLQEKLEQEVKYRELDSKIIFLGFREDIDEIFKMSDIGISASRQEGLGLNLIEEMMCGLPVVATMDRGHREVIDHNKNGFLFPQNDTEQFVHFIKKLSGDKGLYNQMSQEAIQKANKFELKNSLTEMEKIYRKYLTV